MNKKETAHALIPQKTQAKPTETSNGTTNNKSVNITKKSDKIENSFAFNLKRKYWYI